VRAWIESMKDARAEVEALRREIPDDLRRWRDLDYTTRLSDQITLSTFHGCPAGEIEGIVRFLLTEMDVHVTVKLNPTCSDGRPSTACSTT
jgi:putative selenate reductase